LMENYSETFLNEDSELKLKNSFLGSRLLFYCTIDNPNAKKIVSDYADVITSIISFAKKTV